MPDDRGDMRRSASIALVSVRFRSRPELGSVPNTITFHESQTHLANHRVIIDVQGFKKGSLINHLAVRKVLMRAINQSG